MSAVSQVTALRSVVDLLRKHPSLPVPCVWAYGTGSVEVQWQILRDKQESQRDTLNQIRRALGGEWKKSGRGDDFTLTQTRPEFGLTIIAKRDAVCTARVVGTETVTIPAVEAQPERTEERDVIEWDCNPIIGEVAS